MCDWGQVSLATYTECDRHGKTTAILQRHHRHWMAFEVFYENEPALFLSKPADVWAFAMVVIEVSGNVTKALFIMLIRGKIFTNSEPFGKRTLMEVYYEHKAKRRPQRPDSQECNDALWELVCSCWRDDPEERPTAEEVKNRINHTTIVEPKRVCVLYFYYSSLAYTSSLSIFSMLWVCIFFIYTINILYSLTDICFRLDLSMVFHNYFVFLQPLSQVASFYEVVHEATASSDSLNLALFSRDFTNTHETLLLLSAIQKTCLHSLRLFALMNSHSDGLYFSYCIGLYL